MYSVIYVWTQETSGKQIYNPDRGRARTRVKHRTPSLIICSGITNRSRNGIQCHVYVEYCLIVSLLTRFNCLRASLGSAITAHKEGSAPIT